MLNETPMNIHSPFKEWDLMIEYAYIMCLCELMLDNNNEGYKLRSKLICRRSK